MGNQQGKVSETEIAWLAGFLDGEGCFDLQASYAKARRRGDWRPRMRVANTHVATLSHVTRILDGLGVGHHVYWRHYDNPKWKSAWSVEVTGMKRARTLLLAILPFLHTRRERAEQLLEFATSRLAYQSKDGYSPRELQLLLEIASSLKPSQTKRLLESSSKL